MLWLDIRIPTDFFFFWLRLKAILFFESREICPPVDRRKIRIPFRYCNNIIISTRARTWFFRILFVGFFSRTFKMYEAKCIVMDYQHHNAQLQAQTQQHLQQLQSLAPDSTRWNQYQQFWRHQMLMNGIKSIIIVVLY